MKFLLNDYKGKTVEYDIDLEKVNVIIKLVISGDEVLQVFYKDGTETTFDSSSDRDVHYYDNIELIYFNK